MHQSSLDKMKWFVNTYLVDRRCANQVIYDVGSFDVNGSYKQLFDLPNWRYIGLDAQAGLNVDIVLHSPYSWRDLKSNSADVVVSGQAFEHIEWFWLTILEIERVLKPGGICCILAPAAGREHRFPVDCWRFYPDGLKALARFAGLETLVAETNWSPPKYEDGSEEWKDSVLIVMKSKSSMWKRINRLVRRRMLQTALALGH